MGVLPIALLCLLAAPEPLARRTAPGWFRGDVFYEVYLRSFQDSDGDGIGDLAGLIARLDHLAALGVDGLWLMPIFDSPSDHGYAVRDFERLDPRYGSEADFDRLITEAHRRQIAVILDFPINHVSEAHPWFVAAQNGDRMAQQRFVLSAAPPRAQRHPFWPSAPLWSRLGSTPRWYFHVFTPDMPDLDLSDPSTRAMALRWAEHWIARGVDGYRFDAVRYWAPDGEGFAVDAPASKALLGAFTEQLHAQHGLSLAEVWTRTAAAAEYLSAADLVFDFDRAAALSEALRTGRAAPFEAAVRAAERALPPGRDYAVFVSNHDHAAPRAGNFGPGAASLANAAVLLGGGVPFFWQGDELGAQAIDEQQTRRPMRWDASAQAGFTTGTPWREIGARFEHDHLEAQKQAPESTFRSTEGLIALRRGSAALRRGVRISVPVRGAPGVWAFLRQARDERFLVLLNFSAGESRVQLAGARLPAARGERWTSAFGGGPDWVVGPRVSVSLPPRAVRVYRGPPLTLGEVSFARPGARRAERGWIELGPAEVGNGFSADISAALECAARCRLLLAALEAPVQYERTLPPGPYRVELKLAAKKPAAEFSIEGSPVASARPARDVFVRDGRLTIALPNAGPPLHGLSIRPLPFRVADPELVVQRDRVEISLPGPGVIEWRMNRATAEPPEMTELRRAGKRFRATLGPFPNGGVDELNWVVRTPKGYLTAAGGAEISTRLAR